MLATFVAALVVTGAGWAWFAVALLTVIAGGDWYFALTEHRRRRARRFEVTDRWLKSLPKDAWPQ
jgi:cell division protein FtsW (lipid II flippase)